MNDLINYTLHLADNALVLGQRNSEWTGHGPILEQDIAITNISLDLIGQARNFYQYAAQLLNQSASSALTSFNTEDTLAYLRDTGDFKNCLIVEQTNGDWAKTVLRQFFFSTYQYYTYRHLQNYPNENLAAIAEKSFKEVAYHLKWSSEWVIRLGDGTEESHLRMVKAIDDLWMYTGEMFQPADYELAVLGQGFAGKLDLMKNDWLEKVHAVFEGATLAVPENGWMQSGGKEGKHSEHLGYILAEMQFLQRAYPNCEW